VKPEASSAQIVWQGSEAGGNVFHPGYLYGKLIIFLPTKLRPVWAIAHALVLDENERVKGLIVIDQIRTRLFFQWQVIRHDYRQSYSRFGVAVETARSKLIALDCTETRNVAKILNNGRIFSHICLRQAVKK
jgi:hypothetical protein